MTSSNKILISTAVALALGTAMIPATAVADGSGAFIGGMVTSRVLGNMRERTDAEQQQAYYAQQSAQAQQQQAAQQPVQQAAPAAPAQLTPEQRIQQLDKLAAGGYITPDEYKKKKQAIIDSM